jgi:hypothetical protein
VHPNRQGPVAVVFLEIWLQIKLQSKDKREKGLLEHLEVEKKPLVRLDVFLISICLDSYNTNDEECRKDKVSLQGLNTLPKE